MLRLVDDLNPLALVDEAPLIVGLTDFLLEDGPKAMLPPGTIGRVRFPTLMRFDTATDDKRMIRGSGFSHRELPLPLAYKDTVTAPGTGHLDARICGSITEVWQTSDDAGPKLSGIGYLADLPAGHEAHTAMKSKSIRGVSVDLGGGTEMDEADMELALEQGMRAIITRSVMVQATITPVAAFRDAFGELDDDELVASVTFVAEPASLIRPAGWFTDPHFSGPTPVTIDGDHISGHIWAKKWPNHRSFAGPVQPPAFDDMMDFQGGAGGVMCDDGKVHSTGRVVLGGPHIVGAKSAEEMNAAYSATSRSIADVRAGYDQHGIWINGAIRPGTGPKTRYHALASAVSGHWYPSQRDGQKHLHLVLAVNGEGFGVFHEDPLSGELVASGPPREMADMTAATNHSPINGETPDKGNIVLLPDTPADLALDDGEPAGSLHITLKFLGDTDSWSDSQRAALTSAVAGVVDIFEQGPFQLNVGGYGALGPEGAQVAFLESPGLTGFREAIADAVDMLASTFGTDVSDTYDGFTPHMTLAYDGDVNQLAALQGQTFTASTVRVSFGTDATDIALDGGAASNAELVASGFPIVRRPLPLFSPGRVPGRP